MHKKVTTCLIFALLIINIAAISTDIASNESFPTIHNQNTPKSASNSTLNYEDFKYDKFNASTIDDISWAFSSANKSVKITVMAMDSANFSFFNNNTQPFSYATLSPGNVTGDSGTFSPKYSDTWYIIYLNNDTDTQQDTMLSYNTALIGKISDISITSPNSTSYWTMGSHYYIKWNTLGNISSINIDLFKNGKYYYTLADKLHNNGSYYWVLPLSLYPSYFYQIRITDTSNFTVHYFSGYFSIITIASFIITSPNSDSNWEKGLTYYIYWKTLGSIPSVNIFLYSGENSYRVIICKLDNQGSYLWTIPSTLYDSGPYKVKVEDTSESYIYGLSDEFYIGKVEINNNQNDYTPSFTTNSSKTRIILVFSLLLLVFCIFLGFQKRKKSRSNISEMNNEIQKTSQKSGESADNQQITKFKFQFSDQKLSFNSSKSLLPNICPICGTFNDDEAIFCYECGYKFVKD